MNTSPRKPLKFKLRWTLILFLLPVLLWLLLLIVLPHIDLLLMSLRTRVTWSDVRWGLGNYIYFFSEPLYWFTFVRTAAYALITTFITLSIGLPVAFFITKVVKPRLSLFLLTLLLMPFWVSELVRVYGWMTLLRESGVINHFLMSLGILDAPAKFLYNDASMLLGLVYTSMLFMVVPIIATLESLDDSIIEAAYDLGAGPVTIVRKIIIPHTMPGIVSGSIVVFMLSLGNYLTPNLIGGKNSLWFTEQIYNQFIAGFDWNLGAAFGFLLLFLSSFIIWAGLKLTGQKLERVAQ